MELLNDEPHEVWFKLNEEEADSLFEPYDPDDREMDSYLHAKRHRYLKEESYQWLLDNLGQPNTDWYIQCYYDGVQAAFRDRNKAMTFKLAWSRP